MQYRKKTEKLALDRGRNTCTGKEVKDIRKSVNLLARSVRSLCLIVEMFVKKEVYLLRVKEMIVRLGD